MKNQTHEEFLTDHFNTGLKLERGWKFGKHQLGEDINSKSGITVVKGKIKVKFVGTIPQTKISMHPLDGRIGGGHRIEVSRTTRKGVDRFYLHEKKFEDAVQLIHTLMRILK